MYALQMLIFTLVIHLFRPNLTFASTCELDFSSKQRLQTAHLLDLEASGIDIVKSEKLNLGSGLVVPVGIIEGGIDFGGFPPEKTLPAIATNMRTKGHVIVGADEGDVQHGTSIGSIIFRNDVGVDGPGKLVAMVGETTKNGSFRHGIANRNKAYYSDNFQGLPILWKIDLSSAVKILNKSKPKIVNFSGETGNWKETEAQLRSLQSILVTSSGNDPYDSDNPLGAIKSKLNAVVVGGLFTTGVRLGNSGTRVDVLALAETPSYSSKNAPLNPNFGQSSGATALVSSSLIPLISYLPGIDTATTRALLRITATPTAASNGGVGLLNTYKLLKVAHRISQKLKDQKLRGTTLEIASFVSRDAKDLSDFSEEASTASSRAAALATSKDCDSVVERGQLLRKAFLLNPTSTNRDAVVKYYMSLPGEEARLDAPTEKAVTLFSSLGLPDFQNRSAPALRSGSAPSAGSR